MTNDGSQLPPLPDELAALREVSAPPLPSGFEDRVGARVAESIAHLGAAGAAGATAGAGVAVSTAKLIVGAVAVLTTGIGAGIALDRTVLRPEPVVQTPVPVVVTPPPTVPEVQAVEPVKPIEVAPVVPEKVIVKPEPVKNDPGQVGGGRDVSLAAERALLEVARAALAKGDTVHALEALERHEKEHAKGRLREEREALFIEALRAAGREKEADARKEKFLREFPDSLLMP